MTFTFSDQASEILLKQPGAADTPDGMDDRGVAWHYGDPLVEQRSFERAVGMVDRSDRVALSVTGPDSATWLNSLLSQKVDLMEPGQSTSALILDAQGHIEAVLDCVRTPKGYVLTMEPQVADKVLDYLSKMVFWSQVTVAEEHLATVSLVGAKAGECAARLPDVLQARFPWPCGGRVDLLIPRDTLWEAWVTLVEAGARPVGLMAWEAARIDAGMPSQREDLDEKVVPHEVPALLATAVHLHKGCYRGQETVARIENLGNPPRLLVKVQVDGSAMNRPEAGDEIVLAGSTRVVGRMGTVVDHADEGPIALGLVKRAAVAKQLESNGVAVAVDPDSVVLSDEPKAGRVAIERLRGGTGA